MARYTDTIVAALRQRYEKTDQTIHSIAAEFDIGSRNLQRMVITHGWARRSERVRGLPVAMQLLEQAKTLGAVPPPERGRSICEANRVGVKQDETPTATLPLAGGVGWAKRSAPTKVSPQAAASPIDGCVGTAPTAPLPTLPAAPPPTSAIERIEQLPGGGNPTAIERIEHLVVQQIEAEEAARAQLGGKRRAATASERSARTLATLTQTLHALQRLRAGALPDQETLHDDDLPRDIDEFRRDLARRIDAFVASRTDAADADGDCALKPVDEAG